LTALGEEAAGKLNFGYGIVGAQRRGTVQAARWARSAGRAFKTNPQVTTELLAGHRHGVNAIGGN